jgi:hypothetical protein
MWKPSRMHLPFPLYALNSSTTIFQNASSIYIMGANKIQWANMITIKKNYIFFSQIFFSYEWILEQSFLQLVVINVYSCPSTWHVFFFIIFE